MAATLVSIQGPDPVRHVVYNMRKEDAREVFACCWHDDKERLVREIMQNWGELAYVAYWNDEPVALVGGLETLPGTWSAWMVATDKFPFVALAVTKFIRRTIRGAMKARGAHRCEARSMSTHVEAHKWLETLGAKKEAELLRYGKNGEDFFVYRWDD